MNAVLPRFLKSAYRKEPIVSILMTMGLIDAMIGGFDSSWSLFAFGLGIAGISLGWRWWRIQQSRPINEDSVVQHYLPPSSSNSALPVLSASKKKSRQ